MPCHTSKAHAKHETKTKIVLVAPDLTFYGITQLPLFSFVNPFLYRLVPSKRTCPIMSVHTVSKIVLSYRAAKADARTAIGAHAAEMETPFRQISTPNRKPFSSSYWTPAPPEATFHQTPETEILGTYNAAMDEVARDIPRRQQLLPLQLVSWEKKQSSPATILHGESGWRLYARMQREGLISWVFLMFHCLKKSLLFWSTI